MASFLINQFVPVNERSFSENDAQPYLDKPEVAVNLLLLCMTIINIKSADTNFNTFNKSRIKKQSKFIFGAEKAALHFSIIKNYFPNRI